MDVVKQSVPRNVAIVCLLYYVLSATSAIVLKTVITTFPCPLTITMIKMSASWLYALPLLTIREPADAGTTDHTQLTERYLWTVVFPTTVCQYFAILFNYVSIWKMTVSFTETVKSSLPIFTIIVSYFVLREVHTFKVYLSLVPIIIGVAITTFTEVQFDTCGITSAIFCTMLYALHNVYSKKCLVDTKISELRLLYNISRLSMIVSIPLCVIFDASRLRALTLSVSEWYTVTSLIALESVFHFTQNCLAYLLVDMLSQLSYSIANCFKRVVVISASVIVLQNSVSALNVCGMCLAIAGVLYYTVLTHKEARQHSNV
jgi:solute carrier family 35, member E1